MQVSYTATLKRINKDTLQKTNKGKVDVAIKNAKLANQGTRTATEIASTITDAASLLKETGIDVNSFNLIPGTTIGTISATADANGKLTITIEQTTAGATIPLTTSTIDISGKSDAKIAKEIADAAKKADNKKDTSKGSSKAGMIAGGILGSLAMVITGVLGTIFYRKKRKPLLERTQKSCNY